MKLYIIFVFYIALVNGSSKHSYLGCYKYQGNQDLLTDIKGVEDCVNHCEKKLTKFAVLSKLNTSCFCTDFLGEVGTSNSSNTCMESSVYSSKDSLPGPPTKFKVENITDESVQISWGKPENYVEVISYEISASVLHTFSQYPIQNTTWVYSNNTYQTALNLQAASKYNISIRARSREGLGNANSGIIETLVGTPDNLPPPPEIISKNGSRIRIRIRPVINNNGPITRYQVVVLDQSAKQIFLPEYLKNYQDSLDDDSSYYITAELLPEDLTKDFVVGDAKYYGRFFNAPLLTGLDYNFLVGIVSTFNGKTKTAFSNSSRSYKGIHIFDVEHDVDETSVVKTLMVIAIIILSILLFVAIIGFIILRKRFSHKHRHNRLSEQELTLQGPMISVENSAYLPEDEQVPVNHYRNLKQRVRILNLKDELSVDTHSIIGKGKFGTICSAVLRENNESIPLVAYTIPDKSFGPDQRKLMLTDLDKLVRCEKHENIVELVGTSESSHTLYVLLKVHSLNLKQFLLNSRVILPTKFCKVSESQILAIISQIIQGLAELEKNQVYHKQLCAKNIMLTEDLVPKIFGFGLADYVTDKESDYTRWCAVEVLKGNDFNSRSPIWAFGILLWEICALGATPYNNVSNKPELIDKVVRGTRLPQLKYFNDDLYQIMLNCWQVDMSERPNCETLCRSIDNLQDDSIIPFVSFNLFQPFEYEQYKPELELKSFY